MQRSAFEHITNRFPDILDMRTAHGWSVLHFAAIGGSTTMIELILDRGVDINVKTNDGETALTLCESIIDQKTHALSGDWKLVGPRVLFDNIQRIFDVCELLRARGAGAMTEVNPAT